MGDHMEAQEIINTDLFHSHELHTVLVLGEWL